MDDVLMVRTKLPEIRSQVKRGGFLLDTPSTAADYVDANASAVIEAEVSGGAEKLGEVLGETRKKVANAGAAQGFLLDSLMERLDKVTNKTQQCSMSEARGGYKKWLADAIMNEQGLRTVPLVRSGRLPRRRYRAESAT